MYNKVVSDFVKDQIIPTMNQIYNRISKDHDFMSYEDAEKKNKKGVEVISGEDIAKNIQNLCSFNLDDINESKRRSSKRRSVRESRSKDIEDNIQRYCDIINQKYATKCKVGLKNVVGNDYQLVAMNDNGTIIRDLTNTERLKDLVFTVKGILDFMDTIM